MGEVQARFIQDKDYDESTSRKGYQDPEATNSSISAAEALVHELRVVSSGTNGALYRTVISEASDSQIEANLSEIDDMAKTITEMYSRKISQVDVNSLSLEKQGANWRVSISDIGQD